MERKQVFLGGACGNTTWRRDIAIPMLKAAGITYYDPQLGMGEWTTDYEATEMHYKDEADVMLWIISDTTRGIASIAEAAYYIAEKRPLALAMNFLPDDALINGNPIDTIERDDINRGRIFVRTMAKERGVPLFETVEGAVNHAIQMIQTGNGLTIGEVRALLNQVTYPHMQFLLEPIDDGFLIQLRCEMQDNDTGDDSVQYGRKWHIGREYTPSHVIRTALMAVLAWEEHEARERFTYKTRRIFDPHFDVEQL